MPITLNGATGISNVDGSASTPSYQGTDTNTGLFYPAADTVAIGTGGSERLRVDSSGNVGIGTSSPAYKLNVYDATLSSVFVQGDAGANIIIQRSSTDSSGSQFALRKTRGTVASPTAITSGDSAGSMLFQVYGGTNYRNIAYIAGNVDTYTSDTDISGNMRFYTSPSGSAAAIERMRIDSSGNLMVNTTTANGKMAVAVPSGTINAFYAERTGASPATLELNFANAYSNWNSSVRYQIVAGGSGGVYLATTATAWAAVSDERKKDIIEPITDATSKVSSLRAVIGKYKTDDEGTRRSFLIAQDIQSVLPEAVDTTDPDNFGVRYTDVIPLLVAAIQELSAKVDAQAAEITALKAKVPA